ncbi:MAG TPA: uroporphyrinogen-III synthase [Candidatus Limnocylindrales bacterium]|nr:uroporphyrinogen-III synthase [Candidatus Limnocylindrales bacterium]
MTSPRILVTRAAAQAGPTIAALRRVGLDPVLVPAIEIDPVPAGSEIDAAARLLHTYRWVVITSVNGARAILASAERVEAHLSTPSWAAVGASTALALQEQGIEAVFRPTTPDAETLALELDVDAGERVLVVRGDLAGDALANRIRDRGATVDDVVGYTTREAPPTSIRLLRDALEGGPVAAVVFTSGSTVRGFVGLATRAAVDIPDVPVVCIGPATAATARAAGFVVTAVAHDPDPDALAGVTADAVARIPVIAR